MSEIIDHTASSIVAQTIDGEAANVSSIEKKEKIINEFARITQFLTWPILFLLFHTFFNLKIRGRENFRIVQHPFIIISNHISFYDSFLYRLILGFWSPHLPLRFMAVRSFHWHFLNTLAKIGIIDFIYSLFGVFTVVPGQGLQKNLGIAKKIIEVGGDVVIYPEGQIFVAGRGQETIGPFKKGAAVLMLETGVPVVPVAFHPKKGFIRRKLNVNVGAPIRVPPGKTPEEVSEILRDAVMELFQNA